MVAILTTSPNPRDQQRANELSIAAYLTKPLAQQQVEQVIAQYFGQETTNCLAIYRQRLNQFFNQD
ncbi:MAG: hypothetical protein EOO56_00825 [Hymenobacter sp.]|nr:MAG: hypothetical protein EOO56_00825 [Hymenobacter sp.]